jgi:8-oxo-dGTP pyrophosphatase MutT (NUDIX family)
MADGKREGAPGVAAGRPAWDRGGQPEGRAYLPGFTPVALVREAVAAHAPRGAREARSRRLILAALDLLPRPFDRHAAQTHLTASAIVSGPRGTVLHLHKRTGTWLQPGGHLEPGELPWVAALRESAEETGLALRHPFSGPVLLHVDVHPAFDHVHLDLRYLLQAEDEEPQPGPGESKAVRWFSWREAIETTDPSAGAALRAACRVLEAPSGPP